jgi:hypothetical protein
MSLRHCFHLFFLPLIISSPTRCMCLKVSTCLSLFSAWALDRYGPPRFFPVWDLTSYPPLTFIIKLHHLSNPIFTENLPLVLSLRPVVSPLNSIHSTSTFPKLMLQQIKAPWTPRLTLLTHKLQPTPITSNRYTLRNPWRWVPTFITEKWCIIIISLVISMDDFVALCAF